MTTNKTKKPSKTGRLWWKVKTSPSGDFRLIPIKNKIDKTQKAGIIYATITSKMLKDEKLNVFFAKINESGGKVSSIKGRNLFVEVDGASLETVGDVLDSFGCQWEFNE